MAGDGHALLRAPAKPYPPPSPRPPAKVAVEGMRKAIGTALQQSKQTIPHFYATVAVDLTALLELKRAHEASGTKLSVNDFVVRACALALQDEPRVNCRVFPDRIEYFADSNVGIAVGQEFGLVVPVVVKAQTRDLAGLSAEIKRIVSAANAGKLIGSGQGTFTVSNLGMFGVESFSAIINPPEGAILAVGTVTTEVQPWLGGFLPRSILRVTLSSDHRAIDGVLAAKFLARVKHLLENPERL
jgi:pyruvate dehydrogenase E2 component (dihydrolipoamide acetyltransferase)